MHYLINPLNKTSKERNYYHSLLIYEESEAKRGGVCCRRLTVRSSCVGIWTHAIWPAPRADSHTFPAILPHCSLLVQWEAWSHHGLIALCKCHKPWLALKIGCVLTGSPSPPGLTAGTIFSFHSCLSKPFLPRAWRYVRRWLVTYGKCKCSHQALRWGGRKGTSWRREERHLPWLLPGFYLQWTASPVVSTAPCTWSDMTLPEGQLLHELEEAPTSWWYTDDVLYRWLFTQCSILSIPRRAKNYIAGFQHKEH